MMTCVHCEAIQPVPFVTIAGPFEDNALVILCAYCDGLFMSFEEGTTQGEAP